MLKCRYCETTTRKDGTEFTKQGHLNLHEYHCKMKNSHSENRKTEQEKCIHEYRLLNVNQPIENRAYSAGYKEVCVKCQTLL